MCGKKEHPSQRAGALDPLLRRGRGVGAGRRRRRGRHRRHQRRRGRPGGRRVAVVQRPGHVLNECLIHPVQGSRMTPL
uniref:Uncharacterized protein n=1 Tax=Oryza rufipogon TaxID=4529 RepID=A0A0E0NMH3_ORYRU